MGAAVVVAIGVAVVSSVLTRSVDDAIDSELQSRLADVSAAALERADAVVHADQFAQVIGADGNVLVDSSFGARGPVLSGDELADALAGPRRVDRAVDGLGEHARLDSRPVVTPSGAAVVVVGSDAEALSSARSRARLVMYLAPPIAALALGAAAWVLVGAALRPVTRAGRRGRPAVHEPARAPAAGARRRPRGGGAGHEPQRAARPRSRRRWRPSASSSTTPATSCARRSRSCAGEVELAQLALAEGSAGRRSRRPASPSTPPPGRRSG